MHAEFVPCSNVNAQCFTASNSLTQRNVTLSKRWIDRRRIVDPFFQTVEDFLFFFLLFFPSRNSNDVILADISSSSFFSLSLHDALFSFFLFLSPQQNRNRFSIQLTKKARLSINPRTRTSEFSSLFREEKKKKKTIAACFICTMRCNTLLRVSLLIRPCFLFFPFFFLSLFHSGKLTGNGIERTIERSYHAENAVWHGGFGSSSSRLIKRLGQLTILLSHGISLTIPPDVYYRSEGEGKSLILN